MSTAFVMWAAIIGGLTLFMVAGLIWSELQKRHAPKSKQRGSEPGHSKTVLDSPGFDMTSGGSAFGGSGRAWTITKNPQDYAKAFVPSNRSDKQ